VTDCSPSIRASLAQTTRSFSWSILKANQVKSVKIELPPNPQTKFTVPLAILPTSQEEHRRSKIHIRHASPDRSSARSSEHLGPQLRQIDLDFKAFACTTSIAELVVQPASPSGLSSRGSSFLASKAVCDQREPQGCQGKSDRETVECRLSTHHDRCQGGGSSKTARHAYRFRC